MADHPETTAEQPRRSFLTEACAVGVGTLAGAVPACCGAAMFLDPLLRSRKVDAGSAATAPPAEIGEGFLRITTLDSLPLDGTPRSFQVIADLVDAWNKFPQTPIGAVYLRREGDTVSCFNARCPHLGCTVQFREGEQKYVCPCHDSAFNLDGSRNNQIPPRDLDTLEVKTDASGGVWVKFLKFRAGTHEKKPL